MIQLGTQVYLRVCWDFIRFERSRVTIDWVQPDYWSSHKLKLASRGAMDTKQI
jgi:hypothetical protein